MSKEIRPEQIRAARALLGWSRERLAAAANTTEGLVERVETEPTAAELEVAALASALETAGIDFIGGDGPGVRLKPSGAPASRHEPEKPGREIGPESEVRGGPEAPEA